MCINSTQTQIQIVRQLAKPPMGRRSVRGALASFLRGVFIAPANARFALLPKLPCAMLYRKKIIARKQMFLFEVTKKRPKLTSGERKSRVTRQSTTNTKPVSFGAFGSN